MGSGPPTTRPNKLGPHVHTRNKRRGESSSKPDGVSKTLRLTVVPGRNELSVPNDNHDGRDIAVNPTEEDCTADLDGNESLAPKDDHDDDEDFAVEKRISETSSEEDTDDESWKDTHVTGYKSGDQDQILDEKEDFDMSNEEVLPVISKRKYRHMNRKEAGPTYLSAMRYNRQQEARRTDNPFNMDRFCCVGMKCFQNVDKEYAWAQFKRIMMMTEEEERETLKSWLNPTENKIYFNSNPVCYRFLSIGFRFSQDLVASVKGTPKSSCKSGALPRNSNKMSKRASVKAFLDHYANTTGDRMPNSEAIHLPDTQKESVYDDYVKYYRKNHQDVIMEEVCSKSYFYRMWKKDAGMIKARKAHGFTKCDLCEKYRVNMKKAKDNPSRADAVRAAMKKHIDAMANERSAYYVRRDSAKNEPHRFCSFIIDGADQKAYGLPHFVFSTKTDRGNKMKVKCVGVIEHKLQKRVSLFPMTEEYQTGANHIIESLHRVLDAKFHEEGSLPPVMYLQLDNCSRENKNKYLLSYVELLVALGVFKSVEVSFLPVGHTHEDIDQAFSILSRHLKHTDAHSLTELSREMKAAWKQNEVIVSQLKHVINFSGLCNSSDCLRKVNGITQFRYFQFARTDEIKGGSSEMEFKTSCMVKRSMKEDWQPLRTTGDGGFLMHIPDLSKTPDYETNPPSNSDEVIKCLESVEGRVEDANKMRELRTMHKVVYTKRVEKLHWGLDTIVELNYKAKLLQDNNNIDEQTEEETVTADENDENVDCSPNYSYNSGSFVAVNSSDKSPFWIAQVKAHDRKKGTIKVLWYEGFQQNGRDDFYSNTYKPIEESLGTIPAESVFLSFSRLIKGGKLSVAIRNALKQLLGNE